MNQPLQPIIQHLFQVASLEEVSRDRLESFVEAYPSFGIGHYLLSHKLRAEDPGRYQEATQRACLYFSNPFWLQWLLENSAAGNGQGERTVTHEAEAVLAEAATPLAEQAPAEAPHREEAPAEAPHREQAPGEAPPVEETVREQAPREQPPVEEAPGEEPVPEGSPAQEAPGQEGSVADQLLRNIEEARVLRESLQRINGEFTATDEPIHDEEPPFVIDEPREEPEEPAKPEQPAAIAMQEATEGPPPPPVESPGPAPEAFAPPHEASAPTPGTHGPDPAPALVFEPFHTIDYFASQGIRLALDENPGDKLGKQLKSFTEWLKVMRRLPQKERDTAPDRVAEQAVQTFAAHSIESRDVVTETMAEVLAKQGMYDRAKAVYEKLLLLNPDKSAYFAAKIEQLNIP